ncbi:hypothetical protein [Stappia sp.]|uniref:hypothetical protein n=1 Tax=Stappia sp. TaxID=1870903 RepID=UPI003A98F2BB
MRRFSSLSIEAIEALAGENRDRPDILEDLARECSLRKTRRASEAHRRILQWLSVMPKTARPAPGTPSA